MPPRRSPAPVQEGQGEEAPSCEREVGGSPQMVDPVNLELGSRARAPVANVAQSDNFSVSQMNTLQKMIVDAMAAAEAVRASASSLRPQQPPAGIVFSFSDATACSSGGFFGGGASASSAQDAEARALAEQALITAKSATAPTTSCLVKDFRAYDALLTDYMSKRQCVRALERDDVEREKNYFGISLAVRKSEQKILFLAL
eukprot:1574529-Rhodomonas_salina.1